MAKHDEHAARLLDTLSGDHITNAGTPAVLASTLEAIGAALLAINETLGRIAVMVELSRR